jgi:penicillin-binding protein 1C
MPTTPTGTPAKDAAAKTTATGKRPRWKRWRRRLLWLTGFLFFGYYGLPWFFPWPDGLSQPPSSGLQITDRTGKSLRQLLADGQRADTWVKFDSIPTSLIDATLAAEDKRFWSHGGIDFLGMARAVRDMAGSGKPVSGASTITQQLVKISQPAKRRTVWTKIREILTARRVEMSWSKKRILEEYLNRLDYGNLRRGCGAAAMGYFEKPLADCSTAECALLAGLPQAPTRLNPYRRLDAAKARQQWVVNRMKAEHFLTEDAASRALAEPLQFSRYFGEFLAPHFVDLIFDQQDDLPPDGKVVASLDLEVQQFCERTISSRLDRLRAQNVQQAAIVVIDNATGEILALVGSRDYTERKAGQVNAATARRSPGSALKPFTYLIAFQQGDHPATVVPDLPMEFMTPTGVYKPKNYSGRAYGPMSCRLALANSLNLAAVRVLDSCGGAQVLMDALAQCGVTTLTRPADDYGLGLTIGGGEVKLLELVNAYTCLARMGTYLPWRWQKSSADDLTSSAVRIFDPDACWLVADVLADNDARSRSFGSHSPLRLPFPAAVKTGTSTDYRDNWTIGFTHEVTVGVWVGNFDNSPMQGVSGVSGAGPIFREIMIFLDSRRRMTWPQQPDAISSAMVDPLTGLPVPGALLGKRPTVQEKFRQAVLPLPDGADHYDSAAHVLLPPSYAPWLGSRDNWLGSQVAIAPPGHPIAAESAPLRILAPLAGATYLLDPDIPGEGTRLLLRGNRDAKTLTWSSPTLEIRITDGKSYALLKEGRHEITLTESTSGATAATWLQVKRL